MYAAVLFCCIWFPCLSPAGGNLQLQPAYVLVYLAEPAGCRIDIKIGGGHMMRTRERNNIWRRRSSCPQCDAHPSVRRQSRASKHPQTRRARLGEQARLFRKQTRLRPRRVIICRDPIHRYVLRHKWHIAIPYRIYIYIYIAWVVYPLGISGGTVINRGRPRSYSKLERTVVLSHEL
jgi:hypothetical protein